MRLYYSNAFLFGSAFILLSVEAQAQQLQTFAYDVHGRMISVTSENSNQISSSRYVIDKAGNRTSRTVSHSARSSQDRLLAGESSLTGQNLSSNVGGAMAALQQDCNSVELDQAGNSARSIVTAGTRDCHVVMQVGGNLVLSSGKTPVWPATVGEVQERSGA